MAEIIRLLYGRDRRNPIRTFDLSEATTGNLFLRRSGFASGAGETITNYSDPNPRNIDGQDRVNSYQRNAILSINFDIEGSSRAEIASLQAEIDRFSVECGLNEEKRRLEPVWLQHRWDDDLTDKSEPAYGQFSHFYRVLFCTIPNWPNELYTIPFHSDYVSNIVCVLTCRPSIYGLPQLAATGTGQLQIVDDGILVADGITNLFTNPSALHPTDFDNDWSVNDAALLVYHETRPTFTRTGEAFRLVNTDMSNARWFLQTLTLTAADYIVSFYAKMLDGSAVGSLDAAAVIQNASKSTTYIDVGDGWYYCYGSGTAAASSSTHGVAVGIGKSIIVTDIQLELASGNPFAANDKPTPFCRGDLIGCSWSGTAHDSNSSRPNSIYKIPLTAELSGMFSLSIWITFYYEEDWLPDGAAGALFRYHVDADNYIEVFISGTGNTITLRHRTDGSNTDDATSAQTFNYGDSVHFCLVQAEDTIYLYLDGVEAASSSINAAYPANGTLYLGTINDGTFGTALSFDGLKIWDNTLTATEVLALYNNEVEVKNNGKTVGTAPALWDKDGDGGIDAVDGEVSSTDKDNWNVLVGVPGTEPAFTEIQFDPPTSSPPYVYWVGRIETEWAFKPYDTLFLDYSGTADAGASSGDAYETDTTSGSGSDTHDFDATLDEMHALRGHFQVLGRFKVTAAAIDTQPWYKFGLSNAVLWDTVNVTTNASFLLRDFGDMTIEWPRQDKPPQTMTAGLLCTETEGTATTVQLDFLCLLPFPYARIEVEDSTPSFASGDTIVLTTDRRARVMDASDSDSQLNYCYVEGEPITVIPKKYNTLIWLLGAEGAAYDVTKALTNVKVYVTPRWSLPGQAVG